MAVGSNTSFNTSSLNNSSMISTPRADNSGFLPPSANHQRPMHTATKPLAKLDFGDGPAATLDLTSSKKATALTPGMESICSTFGDGNGGGKRSGKKRKESGDDDDVAEKNEASVARQFTKRSKSVIEEEKEKKETKIFETNDDW